LSVAERKLGFGDENALLETRRFFSDNTTSQHVGKFTVPLQKTQTFQSNYVNFPAFKMGFGY
jgi:hypothetical protein